MLVDTSTDFGSRVARRLREEIVAWLVTVGRDGTPVPVPVWFLWDGDDELLIYSKPDTPKLRNIARNPRVAVHLDGNGRGGDIVILTGDARLTDDPPAPEVPEYVEKYEPRIAELGWTADSFAKDYSVALRVKADRVRGH